MGAESAALEKARGPVRIVEAIHQVGSTAKGANRETAPDDFAETAQVGFDSVDLLQPPDVGAEADYFVKNEQDPVSAGDFAHRANEFGSDFDDAALGVE